MKATGLIYFSSTELSDSSIQIKISIYSSKSYWEKQVVVLRNMNNKMNS